MITKLQKKVGINVLTFFICYILNMRKIQIGNCTLYNGDCYEVLKHIEDNSVTLVHSDPPYVVHSGVQKSEWYEKIGVNKQQESLDNAGISNGFDIESVFYELVRICKTPNYQLWCSKKQFPVLLNYAIDNGYSWQDIMLYRNNALPNLNGKYQDKDYCIHMWKGRKITGEYKDRVTDYHWNIGGKKEWNHPALKPIEPIIHMLKVGSDEGDVVLDMFMGSGTTGDACLKTNRKFIGIEKNDLFFEMAVKRISKVFDCLNKNDIKLF